MATVRATFSSLRGALRPSEMVFVRCLRVIHSPFGVPLPPVSLNGADFFSAHRFGVLPLKTYPVANSPDNSKIRHRVSSKTFR